MVTSQLRHFLAVAASVQEAARDAHLLRPPLPDPPILYDALVNDPTLRDTTRQLFLEGHFALAVEEGYKCLNNAVKARAGMSADGADLMRTVFTPKNPLLRLNDLATDSKRDQQLGYMDIFAGCMTGIRNPRAHEHRYLDDPRTALELLSMANHLMRMAVQATRTRSRKRLTRSP